MIGVDGDRFTVVSLGVSANDLTAYSLKVAGLRTDFVGSPKVLVHNCTALASMTAQIKKAGLTSTGRIRLVLPSGAIALVRGPNYGYIDRFSNEWSKGPSRAAGDPYEWNVILEPHAPAWFKDLAKDGTHVNVSLGGVVTH